MAVVKCKECGGQVSTSAKACPHCGGKPPKKTSVVTWIVLAMLALPFVITIIGKATTTPEEQALADIESAKRDERVREKGKEYGIISGSESVIAGMLKDPESAKFGNTYFIKVPGFEYGVVCGTVNAKNSFGAFTGAKGFVFVNGHAYLQGETDGFLGSWDNYCKSK